MKRWNVGIVGYGWVTTAHLTAFEQLAGVTVTAIASSHAPEPTELVRRHGRPIEVVGTMDELLARADVDVVDICSRSNLHAGQAIAAARAGKHLIIEKPIALNLAELRALAEAVRAAGVRTCVCFEVRFGPQFTATRSLIDQGLLGTLHYGEVDYYHDIGPQFTQYEWNRLREGGGSSLLTAGCHAVDGLMFFMGDQVTEVVSYSGRSAHPDFARYEYPTTSVTLLRFAGGGVGKVASVVDALQPYYLRVHLMGSAGTVMDGKLWTTRIAGLDRDTWTDLGVELESSADVAAHPYLGQFRAFFDALGEDREMPLTSLWDALPTFEVVFAADSSAVLGRPVQLSEMATEPSTQG
jgi:predicted dehydrogenase